MEREWGWVKGRGALLGPEESGQLSCWRDGLVFLGRFHTGIFADSGVGVWLGPALTKLLVMVMLEGGFSLRVLLSEGSGGYEPVILPVF
ncbi:hypothetical protein GCM10027269_86920 [Kribbella endophytica]